MISTITIHQSYAGFKLRLQKKKKNRVLKINKNPNFPPQIFGG